MPRNSTAKSDRPRSLVDDATPVTISSVVEHRLHLELGSLPDVPLFRIELSLPSLQEQARTDLQATGCVRLFVAGINARSGFGAPFDSVEIPVVALDRLAEGMARLVAIARSHDLLPPAVGPRLSRKASPVQRARQRRATHGTEGVVEHVLSLELPSLPGHHNVSVEMRLPSRAEQDSTNMHAPALVSLSLSEFTGDNFREITCEPMEIPALALDRFAEGLTQLLALARHHRLLRPLA